MPGEVIVVRHGEPDYEAVRCIGVTAAARNVAPLTAVGTDQARRCGRAMAGRRVVRVVASPMTRALQTAMLVGSELSVGVEIDVGLREWDSGTDGSAPAFSAAAAEFRAARGERSLRASGTWESRARLVERASAAVTRWRDDDQDVVIVTHAFVIEALTERDGRAVGYCDTSILRR